MTDRPTLRVLLAAPDSAGGIARHVAMLAAGLSARGHAVTVAAPERTLPAVTRPGVAAVALDLGTLAGLRRGWRAFRRHAASADVVHAHGVRVGAAATLSGASRLVATWHNAPLGGPARRAVHRGLERVSARGSAVVLGASADLVARAYAAGAARAQPCAVAAPHLTDPVPRPTAGERPTVLAVARLHPQKRLDLLVAASAGWADDPAAPRVLVAGDGPLRADLEAQARRVRAPVEFLGSRDDVADLLATADVVVLSSDWEARPLVAQEALHAGVPLVATDVGGVADLVGDAALLVPPGDALAIRSALVRVLGDAELAAGLRRAGPVRAAGWPTVESMVDDIERIYLDLMSR